MITAVIPDLGGGAGPSTCTRALTRLTMRVHAVDEALWAFCVTAPVLPSLLIYPPLGPTLSNHGLGRSAQRIDHPPVAGPRRKDDRPHLTQRVGDRRTLSPLSPDNSFTQQNAGLFRPAPAPRGRARRTAADVSSERRAACAVRTDSTYRVATAQLRFLAGELPPRSGTGGSRSLPPNRGRSPSAKTPSAERWSGQSAELTRRFGIDLGASLTRPPRPGPSAPADVLDRSAAARTRDAGSAFAQVDSDHGRPPYAKPWVTDLRPPMGGPERSDQPPDRRTHGGADYQASPRRRVAARRRPAEAAPAERRGVATEMSAEWSHPESRTEPSRQAQLGGPDGWEHRVLPRSGEWRQVRSRWADGGSAGLEGPDEWEHRVPPGSGEWRRVGSGRADGGSAGPDGSDESEHHVAQASGEWRRVGSRRADCGDAGGEGFDEWQHAVGEGLREPEQRAARASAEWSWADTALADNGALVGEERVDKRWGMVPPDDGVVETALERVLTDAARRHGIWA
jgi:hypothetical protein